MYTNHRDILDRYFIQHGLIHQRSENCKNETHAKTVETGNQLNHRFMDFANGFYVNNFVRYFVYSCVNQFLQS